MEVGPAFPTLHRQGTAAVQPGALQRSAVRLQRLAPEPPAAEGHVESAADSGCRE